MVKQANYFFLSGLFFVVFLIIQYTEMYVTPIWFKAFLLILMVTFLISGFAVRQKSRDDNPSEK